MVENKRKDFPMKFIRATEDYCTLESSVPAPYFRKTFIVEKEISTASLVICGLGFYDLWVNGKRITKGALAPYISSPDDMLYYDEYDVLPILNKGKNVIAVCLGNGHQNGFGGYIWDFDKARWRGAPQLALRLEMTAADGEETTLETNESFLTAPSPITFDDLHCGEYYDARLELDGWNKPEYDDTGWKKSLHAPMPRGEARICKAEPIVVTQQLKPVDIVKEPNGYRYDFGINCAGVCRLCIRGTVGQSIDLVHGETVVNGELYTKNIKFDENDYVQKDCYICRGECKETYTPTFTYHGFRYVLVRGITKNQAIPELLTYLVMNSDLQERGGFFCSDDVANTLQEITRRSDLANFQYFPVDCPQREKNGWTADAALSAEHMLLNLSPEKSYQEWMRNICKAQNDAGALPGIIPTGGWGFHWGNGPAWDNVLLYLPYFTYIYRGDKKILEESAASIMRYLHYISTRIKENGLISCGLGDWCQPERKSESDYSSPLEFTDTVLTMDIADKSAYIFGELGMHEQQSFARAMSSRLRGSIREKLIDWSTMLVVGNCQTSQAMALHYCVFEPEERATAFEQLLKLIDDTNEHMNTGVLGARVIFHVLTAFGRSDLAYNMITRPDFPSYGNWVARGATSLWEGFQPEGGRIMSLNHHFWGDISSWFIQSLAGIRFNPHRNNWMETDICPSFVPQLSYAQGFHIAPAGKISTQWKRDGQDIMLKVELPQEMKGHILLEQGWAFDDGSNVRPVFSGEYRVCHQ